MAKTRRVSPHYDNMVYRSCGRSGLRLPVVSLGLWHNFGDVDPQKEARAMILRAFDMGITHFDLANNYGPPPGSAEENFGTILKRDLAGHRDELIISSKAGYRMWDGPYGDGGSRKYLISSLDQSLKRMGLDYVDIFYHHRPDTETPLDESLGALDQIVRSGKALYAGISSYDAGRTRQAARMMRELGTPCLIHQPKYSMFNRWIEPDLMGVLRDEGIGCIAFSPLAQGLLTDRYLKGIPKSSRAAKPHGLLNRNEVTEDVISKVRALSEIAQRRGQSMAEMAVAWVLRLEGMTSTVIGASSVRQLEDTAGAMNNLDFSADELTSIDKILGPPTQS